MYVIKYVVLIVVVVVSIVGSGLVDKGVDVIKYRSDRLVEVMSEIDG